MYFCALYIGFSTNFHMKHISTVSFWASVCISVPSILDFPHIPAIRRRLCGMALLGLLTSTSTGTVFSKNNFSQGLLWFFLGWSRNHFGLWYPSIIWWSSRHQSAWNCTAADWGTERCTGPWTWQNHRHYSIEVFLLTFWPLVLLIKRYTYFKLTRSCVVFQVTGDHWSK